MRILTNSRSFSVIINGKETSALVPFADFLNHSSDSSAMWQYDDKNKGFEIIAT